MSKEFSVTCPYCGRSILVEMKNDHYQSSVVTCDADEDGFAAGCGKDFVVKAVVNIRAKAYKIEGEDLKHD